MSYVEPKLRREEERLASLCEAKSRTIGYDLRQAERAIERQEGVIADIRELRDRLDRVVAQHHPTFSTAVIERFAAELGIAPSIVVGRLQREQYVPYSHFNRLKRVLPD
ncbi:hypothetical protein [Candidatus Chloroploca sp. Khr17]|uniref:hypothetical protein n=1 Tax=Candidatus Chloroploca sp. Khr17 TaxID=2496869 RepID=UPI00101DD378|nr:hypothetical protein [Candidatus Chloroploca sp. Khr17]